MSINNLTLNNITGDKTDVNGVTVRAATLVLMQCFIIPGNSLVLAAIFTFTKRSVSDVLIGCLALIDLINGLGPVNISISMYYINSGGFRHIDNLEWLCFLYTWMSSCLRLMACFVATMMAIDRFAAIVVPLFYRTRVTPRGTCLCLLVFFSFSAVIATLPLAVDKIRAYIPICSFDFTSPFAAFIAVLGYLQLVIVVLCYFSVISGVNAFLSRQTLIRATQIRASIAASKSKNRENTLAETSQVAGVNKSSPNLPSKTPRHLSIDYNAHPQTRLRSSSLSPNQSATTKEFAPRKRSQSLVPVTHKRGSLSRSLSPSKFMKSRSIPKCPEIKLSTDVCYVYSNDAAAAAKRGSVIEKIQEEQFETEDEEMLQLSLKQFKRNNSTWKHSRRLAIVMGVVVFLFYISWMPIVVRD